LMSVPVIIIRQDIQKITNNAIMLSPNFRNVRPNRIIVISSTTGY